MRVLFFYFLLALCSLSPGAEISNTTALRALKLIPADQLNKLARIEARDGTPNPERWYLLFYDPAEENGVREFVVAGNQIVASRAISQFAEHLKLEDVIGGEVVQVDSDQVAKLAQEHARSHHLKTAKLNYQLEKGTDGVPLWKIKCVSATGVTIGELALAANDGKVLIYKEFETGGKPVSVSVTSATPAREDNSSEASTTPRQIVKPTASPTKTPHRTAQRAGRDTPERAERIEVRTPETPSVAPEKVEVRRAVPVQPPEDR